MSLDKFYSCEISESDLTELRSSWGWILPRRFGLVVVSALGDAFIRRDDGKILWLNTGTGELSEVGDSEAEFWANAKGDSGLNWFMPMLLTELVRHGEKVSAIHMQFCQSLQKGSMKSGILRQFPRAATSQ